MEAWVGRGDAWRSAQGDADFQKLMAEIKAELDHSVRSGTMRPVGSVASKKP